MKTKTLTLALIAALLAAQIFAQGANLSQKTITVPEPIFKNGTAQENWIPAFVQGLVTTNLQKYSGMQVIDRQNVEQILKEQKRSYEAAYSEDTQIEVGELVSAQYIVAINIIKKGEGYSVDYKITETKTGKSASAYTDANCTEMDMNDGSSVNNASRELLIGLGIAESKLADLSKANIQKQKAAVVANEQIAKGMAAEKAGNVVEAISFYQKAVGNSAGITEAASRMKSTTTNMVSGGISANVAQEAYDEIAQLNREVDQWIKIYTDFWNFFQNSNLIEVYYHEDLPQGKRALGATTIEYNIDYGFRINYENIMAVKKTIDEAFKSIDNERREWYLEKSRNSKQLKRVTQLNYKLQYNEEHLIASYWTSMAHPNKTWFEIKLVNSKGKTIASYKRDLDIILIYKNYWNEVEREIYRTEIALKKYDSSNRNEINPFVKELGYSGEREIYRWRYDYNREVDPPEASLVDINGVSFDSNDLARSFGSPKKLTANMTVDVADYTPDLKMKVEVHNGTCIPYEQYEKEQQEKQRQKELKAAEEQRQRELEKADAEIKKMVKNKDWTGLKTIFVKYRNLSIKPEDYDLTAKEIATKAVEQEQQQALKKYKPLICDNIFYKDYESAKKVLLEANSKYGIQPSQLGLTEKDLKKMKIKPGELK